MDETKLEEVEGVEVLDVDAAETEDLEAADVEAAESENIEATDAETAEAEETSADTLSIADLLKGGHSKNLQKIIDGMEVAQSHYRTAREATNAALVKCYDFANLCDRNLDTFDALCETQV